MVSLLLDHGVNIEVRNRVGYSPLLLAAFFCHIETCRLLLEKGKANIGNSSFNPCVLLRHSDRSLGSVEARDSSDNTALQSACRRKAQNSIDAKKILDVVSYLISKGALRNNESFKKGAFQYLSVYQEQTLKLLMRWAVPALSPQAS